MCWAQGGKASARNPILREDVLLARSGMLRPGGPAKAPAAPANLDPFAPEYGTETWHAAAGGRAGGRARAAVSRGGDGRLASLEATGAGG
jgi:hypothetical protein